MLRVGLTGDLGSGKSTVAEMLVARGAIVLSSDEMARAMMQRGEAVYAAIVERFGREVLDDDGSLDRGKLARLAFDPAAPRVEELNAIVHPAVIAAQTEQIAAYAATEAIVVVESALLFSASVDFPWTERFDRILLVTAPLAEKVARFVARSAGGRTLSADARAALEADARRRIALQDTEAHAAECRVLHNDSTPAALEAQVVAVWAELTQGSSAT